MSPPTTEQEFISTLTQLFLAGKQSAPFISLRLWYEDGCIKYFFTNNPPKNYELFRRNSLGPPLPASIPDEPPAPLLERNEPVQTNQNKSKRGRPARKRRRPSDQSLPSPEIPRSNGQAFHSVPEEVSDYDAERDISIASVPEQASDYEADKDISVASVPCSNSFQILADLEENEGLESCDEKNQEVEKGEGISTKTSSSDFIRECVRCKQMKLVTLYDMLCRDCWATKYVILK